MALSTPSCAGRQAPREGRAALEKRVASGAVRSGRLGGRRVSKRQFFEWDVSDGSSLVDFIRSPVHAVPDLLDFTFALCCPPYSLGLSPEALERLFLELVQHVLGDPDDDTEIWRWQTEWSEYFDAGRDWWGTGLWTVDMDDSVVVVLASASD
jgi:hypothetical protein